MLRWFYTEVQPKEELVEILMYRNLSFSVLLETKKSVNISVQKEQHVQKQKPPHRCVLCYGVTGIGRKRDKIAKIWLGHIVTENMRG